MLAQARDRRCHVPEKSFYYGVHAEGCQCRVEPVEDGEMLMFGGTIIFLPFCVAGVAMLAHGDLMLFVYGFVMIATGLVHGGVYLAASNL